MYFKYLFLSYPERTPRYMNLCFLLQGIVNPFGRGTRWFNMTNHIYPTPPGTRLMSDLCMENITFHTRKRQSSCNRS